MAMMSGGRDHRVRAAWLGTWIGLAAVGSAAHAQDAHYWTLSYGTRATLLGGAVIGSTSDLSATFYNPGAVGLLREQGFILSAKVYEYNTLRVEDGGGEGVDLVSSGTTPLPSFVAGAFRIGRLEHSSFAYSVLTRQSSHFRTDTRLVEDRDVIPNSPGDEPFAGEFLYEQNLGDLWMGLSWSYPLSKKVGVGVTQYFALRDQHPRLELAAEALTAAGDVASVNLIRDFDYRDLRLLWKAGLAFNLSPLTFGITATTPGVHLYGNGSTFINTTLIGLDTNGDQIPDPVMAAQQLEDVPADYRSPWSVGLGGAYRFGDTILHTSAEWFEAIEAYDVLDTTPFQGQTSGASLRFPVTQELKSVLNYGIGVEQRFAHERAGYVSFVTDLSARIPGSNANASVASWDLYHISGGASFNVGRVDMVLGGTFSFGSEDVRQITDVVGEDPSHSLGDGLRDAKVRTHSYRIVFGFSVGS
jgi:hypothetical protein